MSEDGEGGGEGGGHEAETPGLSNLWGLSSHVGTADDHKGQMDSAMLAGHDAWDAFNGLNVKFGLTQGMKTANQAEHLATNAWDMGNMGAAQKFAHLGEEARESGFAGGLNKVMEGDWMGNVGKGTMVGANVLSGVMGGLNMAKGFGEWGKGEKTQGAMDIGAGALGVGAGALGAASTMGMLASGGALAAAVPFAAPVAAVAGLAAAGNEYTKDHDLLGIGHMFGSKTGLWGEGPDGKARDSLQFVGQTTAAAYNGVDNAVENKLGHGFWGQAAGKTLGGLAGAGTAIGTGATALVGDVAGGVAATGIGLYNGAKALGSGIGSVASSVGSGIGSAAKSVGSGIASGAKAIGGGISSAAHSVGSFVKSLW